MYSFSKLCCLCWAFGKYPKKISVGPTCQVGSKYFNWSGEIKDKFHIWARLSSIVCWKLSIIVHPHKAWLQEFGCPLQFTFHANPFLIYYLILLDWSHLLSGKSKCYFSEILCLQKNQYQWSQAKEKIWYVSKFPVAYHVQTTKWRPSSPLFQFSLALSAEMSIGDFLTSESLFQALITSLIDAASISDLPSFRKDFFVVEDFSSFTILWSIWILDWEEESDFWE